ncbi:LOW QUALITY PROTEIN: cytochrome P450 6a2-like [Aphomia sociella]
MVGGFRSSTPLLVLIRNPEMVKQIIVSDFYYFYERRIIPGKSQEPLHKNLFFGEGDLWRLVRQRLTPAFTSGKLKAMFPIIVERAEYLRARTLKAAVTGHAIDARDLMARYTTDFIGACGFGLEADSLNEEDSAFRKLGREIFTFSYRDIFITLLKELFPSMTRNLKVMGKIESELILLVKEILRKRNYKPSQRHDFIDLLLECKNQGTVVGESIEHFNKVGTPKQAILEFDEIIIAVQVIVFFAADFETSSSATSYTLHQLAHGARLGLIQSLAGLAIILSQFSVVPAPETKRYPTVDPTSHVVQSVSGGFPLIFRERKDVKLNKSI